MTITTTPPPVHDLIDEDRLRALAHGLGGPAEVDALLTLFVALLRQRVADLVDAVSSADADRIAHSCRTLGEPAHMLGLDRLHRLVTSLDATPAEDGPGRRELTGAVQQCADETSGEILRRLAQGPRRVDGPDHIELMLRRLGAPGRRRRSSRR